MGLHAGKLLNGDYQVTDTSEDAPLLKVSFHNQAAQMPVEVKNELFRSLLSKFVEKYGEWLRDEVKPGKSKKAI